MHQIYDVLLDPYHFSDNCESALEPNEIQSRTPVAHFINREKVFKPIGGSHAEEDGQSNVYRKSIANLYRQQETNSRD